MTINKNTGKKGEELAKIYLESKGYIILEINWRFSRAEIDIIAKENDVLVFVEVKTRTGNYYGDPEDFVTIAKEDLVMDAAGVYAQSIGHDWEVRFDVISIMTKGDCYELKHFKDVFFQTWN